MHPLDALVLILYGSVVVGLGAWAQRRQSGTRDFFLGGRDLPWALVGASILATAFSAASLLGGPGEAQSHGLLWLQLQLGDLLAILVVIWLFVPALRGRDLTTAYEYLEHRFDGRVRLCASLLFQGQVLFRAGVLVYGPALALATLTGLDVSAAILLVGVVATTYTVLGGITAVVWTDVLQLVVVVAGLLLCAFFVARDLTGGIAEAFSVAAEAGRLRIVDPAQSWLSVRSLPGAVIGYGLLSLSVAGTNQQPVQRYLSCRSVSEARRAAFLGWGVGLLVTLLTLLVGILLFAYYTRFPSSAVDGLTPDAIFPHFVGERLPPGVTGLILAAIFAAAMSSLDSALNSLATASVADVYARFVRPGAEDRHYLRTARGFTVLWGVLGTAAGLYVAGQGTLLALAVRWMGYFAGPMLGLFLLGLLVPRVRAGAALAGMAAAFVAVVLTNNPDWLGLEIATPGIWNCAVGGSVTMAVAILASFLRPVRAGGQGALD